MRGNASRHPDKRESATSAKARLQLMLYNCTDTALSGFTPDGLAATHRLSVRDCEYLLIVARQKRASQAERVLP